MSGTGVANPTLASGRNDRTNRPDIWTQAIVINAARQPLQEGRRPHMGPRLKAEDDEGKDGVRQSQSASAPEIQLRSEVQCW